MYQEFKYIPFSQKESELFRGQWIKNKYTNQEYLILSVHKYGIGVMFHELIFYRDLLDEFVFLNSGKPVGKQVRKK